MGILRAFTHFSQKKMIKFPSNEAGGILPELLEKCRNGEYLMERLDKLIKKAPVWHMNETNILCMN